MSLNIKTDDGKLKVADVGGSGGIDSKIEYDFEEREIGTWFGETLYQKTFKANVHKSSLTLVAFDLTSLNVKDIMYDLSGSYIFKTDRYLPILSRYNNYEIILKLEYLPTPTTKNLQITFNNINVPTDDSMFIVLTIRYTKNSD